MSGLSELPTDVIRTALAETIENKLKSKKYNVTVTSASKAGENNFIGVVYRVVFSKEDEIENEKNPTYKLILKVAPQNVARRAQFFSRNCFLREIYMYDEILPYLRQFEESKGIVIEETGFHEYPKCYRTVDEEPSESVLLEDLSVRDFRIIDRFTEDITVDHVNLVMQSLAKLHAISFVLKDEQPDKFKQLTSNLSELFVRDDPTMREYLKHQCEVIFGVVSAEEDAHFLAKVKKLFEKDPIDIAAECLDLESTGAASVITHGDAWQNNTMFIYNKNGKPIEINLVDWQISRHSSPIIDIVYYMFSCTTKELRDAHYENFLKVYHESLSAHIRRLGSDPDRLFPIDLMQEHFRKFGKFGLIMATALLPIITQESGSGLDLDVLAEQMEEMKAKDFMKDDSKDTMKDFDFFNSSESSRVKLHKRLRDVVIDMVRLEYI